MSCKFDNCRPSNVMYFKCDSLFLFEADVFCLPVGMEGEHLREKYMHLKIKIQRD